MRHWGHLALAVAVIIGWLMALIWVVLSVSQIAVLQVVSPTLCVPSQPWAVVCSP